MERKKQRIRWRKVTGGTHRHSDGKVYRKGDTLLAHHYEIPKLFASDFVCLDAKEDIDVTEDQGITLEMKHKGGGWYDIINTVSGSLLSEKPLKTAGKLKARMTRNLLSR